MSGDLPATSEYVDAASSEPAIRVTESGALPPSESATDTYALASGSRYTQTEEQEQETRSVEEYLRRLSEKEKRQRRKRLEHAPLQPTGGTSLVRKISHSLARVPSLRTRHTPHRAGASSGSYEMTQSHYIRDGNLPAPYPPVTDESEESQFASDSRHEQDMAPLHPVAYVRSMDLSSTSLDDLSMFNDARKHDDTPAESPTSPLESPGPYSDGASLSRAMSRLHSRDFPSVTVGRASSLQRRQQAARSASVSARAEAPRTRYANTIEAIPESDSADVALASVPRSDVTDEPTFPSQASIMDSGYPPLEAMSRSEVREEPSTDPHRWYWSDLLLTCGLCLSTHDDEEQAARTNPME